MASPVSQAPTAFALANVRTGRAVVSGGFSRWADEVSFLVGHNVHKAGDVFVHPRGAGRTTLEGLAYSVHVPYSRSAGAQVVRVAVELHTSDEIADSQTVTAKLPSGAAWIDAGGLDGSRALYNPPRGRTAPTEYVGWLDISGCTVGALADVLTLACTPTTKGAGVRRVSVVEVPLGSLAIDATEPGWDAAAARPGRLVIDGGASSPRGVQRLFHCLDNARANWRKHLLIGDIESSNTAGYGSTPHWSRMANSSGAIDWLLGSGAADPRWYLQTRRLYGAAGSATPTSWRWRVRYRTSNSTDCNIDLITRGGSIASRAFVGAAAGETTQSLLLPGTSGAWAWASTDVTLPGDGTDGLVRVRFEAAGPGTGQLLSLACLGLLENEA